MKYSLDKQKRLKSEQDFKDLWAIGSSFRSGALRIVFCLRKNASGNRAAVAVGKRNFKKAVDRNLLKRRMREAYRLNQHLLTDGDGRFCDVLFIYQSQQKEGYETIERWITKSLKKIAQLQNEAQ